MNPFQEVFDKAGALFGLDMKLTGLLGLLVYAVTQGAKKKMGRVGWAVVPLVIAQSLFWGIVFNCVHDGALIITYPSFVKSIQYAVFIFALAMLPGLVNSTVTDNRPLPDAGPGLPESPESSAVEAPTIEMPALASVLPIVRVPRQKTRFELGVHAFADAFFKGKNNA